MTPSFRVIICANYYIYVHIIQMPTATDIRDKRRQALLEILATGTVSRQSQFVQQLNAQGIEATQSSVSRDLRELGIVKRGNGYRRIEAGDSGTPGSGNNPDTRRLRSR